MRGFVKGYTMWTHYGETVVNVDADQEEAVNIDYLDQYVAVLDGTWTNM